MSETPPPLPNSYWVIPGQLLAGEYPGGPRADVTRGRIDRLLAAGINSFLDLTGVDELSEYAHLLPPTVEHYRMSIEDHGTPRDTLLMTEILSFLRAKLQSERRVYVHCRAGIGRTGTVVGCLLVEGGLQGDDALYELNRLWQKCARSQSWAAIPETDEQIEYVRSWQRQLGIVSESLKPSVPAYSLSSPTSPVIANLASHRIAAARAAGVESGPAAANGARVRPAGQRATDNPPALSQPTSDARLRGTGAPLPSGTRSSTGTLPSAGARPGTGTPSPADAPLRSGTPSSTDVRLRPSAPPAPDARLRTGLANEAYARGATLPITQTSGPATATSDYQPSFEPQPPAANFCQRYLGALLGLAVGDALSAATHQQKPGSFTPISDLIGGGPFELPRGGWSDDTAMALCLAESLLACRGFDARDQVERYTRWQKDGHLSATGECLGITPNTTRALAVAQWRRQIFPGSHDPALADPSPLSRIAPAVMFFLPFREQALEFASDSARTTCQAPRLLEACKLQAAVMHAALEGQPKPLVLTPPWNPAELKPRSRIKGLLERRYRGKIPPAIRAGNRIVDPLEVALWAFDLSNSFAEGALLAVNVGEKSDVTGAVYGQIAGAYYGADAIPLPWRNALINKDLIEDLALKLLAQTKVDPGA